MGDTIAGLTVGIMLVPQSMAYAMLAGMPPIYGLYASLIPLIVYALFASSRHISPGTVAIDSLIMFFALALWVVWDASRAKSEEGAGPEISM